MRFCFDDYYDEDSRNAESDWREEIRAALEEPDPFQEEYDEIALQDEYGDLL